MSRRFEAWLLGSRNIVGITILCPFFRVGSAASRWELGAHVLASSPRTYFCLDLAPPISAIFLVRPARSDLTGNFISTLSSFQPLTARKTRSAENYYCASVGIIKEIGSASYNWKSHSYALPALLSSADWAQFYDHTKHPVSLGHVSDTSPPSIVSLMSSLSFAAL